MNENRIVITNYMGQLMTCIYHDNQLTSIMCDEKNPSLVGNIYLGKVKSMNPNINAAFIEIEKDTPCYLPLEDCKAPFVCNRTYDGRIINGDEIIVQVVKDRVKTKVPVVTTNLSLAGKYSVVSSQNKKIGYSNKLTKQEKVQIKEQVESIFDENFGYVIRTNSSYLLQNGGFETIQTLKDELVAITTQLSNLITIGKTRTVFSCLYRSLPMFLTQIRDQNLAKYDQILTDIPLIKDQIHDYLSIHQPTFLPILKEYNDPDYALFKLLGLKKEITDALARKVWLKSGGYLIIDTTEALTVIDVNSGKFAGKKNAEETFLKINKEAATEIAKQLQLRNLSGIIIIDFINMDEKSNNKKLIDTLKAEIAKDSVKTSYIDMTALGLVEVTRKRVYQSLREQLLGVNSYESC